jgi:hypothetical protein
VTADSQKWYTQNCNHHSACLPIFIFSALAHLLP